MFRTYEPTRDRLIAVKVFRLDITPEQAKALADELASAAEAGLFHPSIVEPVAAGVEGTVAYRAEEYVAAESLDAAIRHHAPAPLDKALPFITQLAGAIDFARAAGVKHGALHLRDIFVTPDEARASGFGVVEALERTGLRAPVRRPYSAPERIAGEAWDTPADVFSLAAIAFELLTGRRPSGTGPQIGDLTGGALGDYSAAVHAVLARAMDDQASRRYQSALAFASALEAAARGERVTGAIEQVGVISGMGAATGGPARVVEPPRIEGAAPIGAAAVPLVGDPDEALPLSIRADAPVDETVEDLDADLDEDDAAAERDLDVADAALALEEADAWDTTAAAQPHEASLFDHDEAAEDLALDAPESDRFTSDFSDDETEADRDDERAAAAAVAAAGTRTGRGAAPGSMFEQDEDSISRVSYDSGDAIADDMRGAAPPEPPRMAMLPLALASILCLLIGFTAGYAVGSRDDAPDAATADAERSTPQSPGTTEPAAATPGGKPYSEQAVVEPPSTPPPPVPEDAPAPTPEPERAVPAAAAGRLVVRSTPSRAGVTVNGEWKGRTPLTLDKLAIGAYSVRVVQQGYEVSSQDVRLTAGQPARTLTFRLQRPARATATRPPAATRPAAPSPPPSQAGTLTGSIYVDSRPRGARVLIDGKPVGVTPLSVPDIRIGSHVVRIELDDHRPWTTSTSVKAADMTRVTGSLERIR